MPLLGYFAGGIGLFLIWTTMSLKFEFSLVEYVLILTGVELLWTGLFWWMVDLVNHLSVVVERLGRLEKK